MEHYDELGVRPTATTAEIRSSYLALARRFHPDRLTGGTPAEREQASARMAKINASWSVLSDEHRRAAYDAAWKGDAPSGATVRDAGHSWTAFDDEDDAVDPRFLDDTPSGAPTLRRSVTFLPAGLAAAGAVTLIVGFMIGLGPLLAVGLVLEICAGLSFLVVPLIALANSSRAERDW